MLYFLQLIQRVDMRREENEKQNVSVENKNEREENGRLKLKEKKQKQNRRLLAVRKISLIYLISQ